MTGTGDAWLASAPNDHTALVGWLTRMGWTIMRDRDWYVTAQLGGEQRTRLNASGGLVRDPKIGVWLEFTASGRLREYVVQGRGVDVSWQSGTCPLGEARQRLWTALQEVTDG